MGRCSAGRFSFSDFEKPEEGDKSCYVLDAVDNVGRFDSIDRTGSALFVAASAWQTGLLVVWRRGGEGDTALEPNLGQGVDLLKTGKPGKLMSVWSSHPKQTR